MRNSKVCEICEDVFYSNHRSKIYCSNACKQKAYRDRNDETPDLVHVKQGKSVESNNSIESYVVSLTQSWAKRIIQIEKDACVHIAEVQFLNEDARLLKSFVKENSDEINDFELIGRFLKFVLHFTKTTEEYYHSGNEENGYLYLNVKNKEWSRVCSEVLEMN